MSRLQLKPNVSIIHSLRSIGYSLDISIADILDNSITASAKNIHIDFEIQSDTKDIHLAIVDDGLGMDFFQLQQAMTLGSKDPNQNRDMDDLGRFGLGLKTASFSQCKCLTLISKQAENICGLQMDLDENERHQDWGVRELSTAEMQSFLGFERLAECASGTLVAWRKCDRLLDGFENNNLSDEEFANQGYEKFATLHTHLGLVFHRWLKPTLAKRKIHIHINNRAVEAIDPFAKKALATQEHEKESIGSGETQITIQAFTLPHHSKCSKQEYDANSLGDYVATQGFYVYRNDRLLIGGDWFRLHPKQELSKLCRVAIDLPNTLDHQWKIDVKKSTVELPLEIKQYLKGFILRFVAGSKRVYTHRGFRQRQDHVPFWDRLVDKNLFYYAIRAEHPMIQNFMEGLDAPQQQDFQQLLSLIAEYLPKDQIFADLGQNPQGFSAQWKDTEIVAKLNSQYQLCKDTMSKAQFIELMQQVQPFNQLSGSLEALLDA